MADNGVKPHTTVTVTTQSGLAPQVCLALMPLSWVSAQICLGFRMMGEYHQYVSRDLM